MAWFIKTEFFTPQAKDLSLEIRRSHISRHRLWVSELNKQGITASSGYLVDENHVPGGGGLLILKADTYSIAKSIIKNDPIILAELVTWELHEFMQIVGPPIIDSQRG